MPSMIPDSYARDGDYVLVVCPNPSIDIFAWIDQIIPRNCNRTNKEQRYPGGKGVHVALALAELNENVRIVGFWGGPTGTWIRSECEKRYSNLKCVGPLVDEWSRCCYTYKSDDQFDETEILGIGPALSEGDLHEFYELFNSEIVKAKCVVLSGSWPVGAVGDEYQRLIEIATLYNKASFIDCTGDQLANTLKVRPYTVHLNRSEFFGQIGDQTPEVGLRLLLDRCDQLALTDGANGLYLMKGHKTVHAVSKVEQVHSAVGSGDCLIAGLTFAFIKGFSTLETAKFGASCGAANCLRSDLGMLFRQDVYDFYKTTQATVSRKIPDFV